MRARVLTETPFLHVSAIWRQARDRGWLCRRGLIAPLAGVWLNVEAPVQLGSVSVEPGTRIRFSGRDEQTAQCLFDLSF